MAAIQSDWKAAPPPVAGPIEVAPAGAVTLPAPAAITVDNATDFLTSMVASIDAMLPEIAGRASATPASPAVPAIVALDMTPLERFDSAAIAALIELKRHILGRNLRVVCVNAPPNLRKLAALYDVEGLLCAT